MTQGKSHYATTGPSNRNYSVYFGDELLFESSQSIELNEHYDGKESEAVVYFPAAAITGLDTEPSELTTSCPIKGQASYLSFRNVPNGIWYYADPLAGVESIRGHVAFDLGKGFRILAQ